MEGAPSTDVEIYAVSDYYIFRSMAYILFKQNFDSLVEGNISMNVSQPEGIGDDLATQQLRLL